MKRRIISMLLSAVVVFGLIPGTALAAGSDSNMKDAAVRETGFAIYQNQKTAAILMDESYDGKTGAYAERTYRQIRRAAGDLRQDVAMVTGAVDFEEIQQVFSDTDEMQEKRLSEANQSQVPQLVTDDADVPGENVIIVGSIENSSIIKSLMTQGKLDEAKQIENESEAYIIKQVSSPVEGNSKIKNALVIAGSDARGTIYGIYTVSEKIGVSPWYWWSDVPVDVVGKEGAVVYDSKTIVENSPSVPYRGIFINDEEQLREWAYQKEEFSWPDQVSHPGVYRHVFELLLRLKANTLWPAMHEGTSAFNSVTAEDGTELINAKNAAEYGIIMGSSHCEMMLRNNVGEWKDWYNKNKAKYNIQGSNSTAAWDYTINKNVLLAYWEERIAANKDFENVFSVGLRGVHDGGPTLSNLDNFIKNQGQNNALGNEITVNGTSAEAKKVALMKDVIKEQRKLIKKYYGAEDGALQAFIPYKEMNDYYNYNNRDLANWLEEEAADVILVWSNDNYGYLRQTPNEQERKEGRRNGVYYHNSYWGYPKSWLWLNSASIARMNTEMHRAYNTGADDYWILNVGDIKPGEICAEYFMKMAWDIENSTDDSIKEALAAQAKRDFNVSQDDALQIAECLENYYQYNETKRAEFYGQGYDFSVSGNGDEGMLWVNQWNDLVTKLETIYDSLDENAKDAFYEQILHAVRSSRDVAEEYIYYLKNQQAVRQGRYGSSRIYRQMGIRAIERIKEGQNYFWSLNDKKWYGVINYSHRASYREGDGSAWHSDYQPNQGILLKNEDSYTIASEGEGIGAACENASEAGSGKLIFNSLNAGSGETHYFDVFGKEKEASAWLAEAPEWIQLSESSGSVYTEKRVTVNIDWSKITESKEGEIKVYNGTEATGTPAAIFTVKADFEESQLNGDKKGYQEANGYVMIEAEYWSENTAGTDGTKWQTIHSLGQRGDSIRITTKNDNKVDAKAGDASAYHEFADNKVLTDSEKAEIGHVAYNVYFKKAGTYKMTAYRIPFLDEYSKTCRTAVVVNGKSSSGAWIRGNAATTGTWAANILRMIEPMSSASITVNQGWNTIELYRMSPSQAFDRFLIVTDSSVAPALSGIEIGAPISPNNVVAADKLQEFQKSRIGVLPKELTDAMDESIVMDESIEIQVGEKVTIDQNMPGYPEGYTLRAVKGNNETAVKIQEVTVTGKRAGLAELELEFIDGEGKPAAGVVQVRVTKENSGERGMYQITKGKLVIDTADALENSEYAKHTEGKDKEGADKEVNHDWQLVKNGLSCLPDTSSKLNWLDAKWNLAPGLHYMIHVTDETKGSYTLYVNRTAPDDAGDSYYVVLDGALVGQYGDNQSVSDYWDTFSKKIEFPEAGTYTLSLFAREDGVALNQILLSREAENPQGYQTATRREGETLVLPEPVYWYDFEGSLEETNGKTEAAAFSSTLQEGSAYTGALLYTEGRNGAGEALDLNASYGLDLNLPSEGLSEDYTVSLWVQPQAAIGWASSVLFMGTSEDWISLAGHGLWFGKGGTNSGASAVTYTQNEWQQFILSVKDGKAVVYQNGQEIFKKDVSNTAFTATDRKVCIGLNWWDDLQDTVIDDVKVYGTSVTAEEAEALYKAESSVKPVPAEKTELKKALDTKVDDKETYTAATWKTYEDAWKKADAVYKDADAKQSEVNEAARVLTEAVSKLEKRGDKSALKEAIAKAEAIPADDEAKYTKDSWEAMQKALADAKTVNEDANATQTKVNSAAKKLEDAIAGLEEKPDEPELPYDDVEEGTWYYDAIAYNYYAGTMTGLTPTHFGPADTLVRAQFASVLHKMNGEVEVEYTDKFADVAEPDWFKNAVLWAAENEIVTGYTGTDLFGANDVVTREQMATMMYRYAKNFKEYEVSADGDCSEFPDAETIQPFAQEAMKWAVKEGIIKGKTIDGVLLLDPQGSANRAECATIIQRFLEKFVNHKN